MVVRFATDKNILRNTDSYNLLTVYIVHVYFKLKTCTFSSPYKVYRYLPSGHTFFSYEVKEQIFFYKGGEKYLFSGYIKQYDYEIY